MTDHVQHRPLTVRLRRELLVDVLELLADRYPDPDLTLDDVARGVASSRRQLQRLFEESGDTFRAHLTRLRMDRASELLATTSLPVGEISRQVGYRQSAQFAKSFRRHTGSSPLEWRSAERLATLSAAA
jgi:AraC family transcriptional regulator of adaptative response / methylphosphotriester-DNA alkyltransferase methyltransferase